MSAARGTRLVELGAGRRDRVFEQRRDVVLALGCKQEHDIVPLRRVFGDDGDARSIDAVGVHFAYRRASALERALERLVGEELRGERLEAESMSAHLQPPGGNQLIKNTYFRS